MRPEARALPRTLTRAEAIATVPALPRPSLGKAALSYKHLLVKLV